MINETYSIIKLIQLKCPCTNREMVSCAEQYPVLLETMSIGFKKAYNYFKATTVIDKLIANIGRCI